MQRAPTPPEDFEPWEIELIENTVRRFLATRLASPLLSLEDLIQEGLLHWWRQRSRYASDRGASPKTFLKKVVGDRLLDIEQELQAQKRGGKRGALSFDAPLNEEVGGDEVISLLDLTAAPRQSEVPLQAIERAKARLTVRQRRAVESLDEGYTVTEAAKRLGVHRDTLYQDLKRIKEVFIDEGLEEFLF